MSYNGSGSFLINSAGQPVVSGTTISSTAFNSLTADLATGLSNAICKDGQSTPSANIPLGGFKITNLASGTVASDAVNYGQIQSGAAVALTGVAGTNTVTASLTPTPASAYPTGAIYRFVPAATNTGATTLNINALGAKNVFWNGAALVGAELQINVAVEVYYDGTQFQLVGSGAYLNAGGVSDAIFLIRDDADPTKQAAFQLSGLTTGIKRTYTMPDGDFSLAVRNGTQTFGGTQFFSNMVDISAAGAGQIKFPATENPSSDPNTLDDYQEFKAWTPVDSSGAGLSFTVVANGCYAMKIGRVVFCSIDITFPSTANGSNVLIGGLPYTAYSGQTNATAFQFLMIPGSATVFNFAVLPNTITMNIYGGGSLRVNSGLSTNVIRGLFTYIANA